LAFFVGDSSVSEPLESFCFLGVVSSCVVFVVDPLGDLIVTVDLAVTFFVFTTFATFFFGDSFIDNSEVSSSFTDVIVLRRGEQRAGAMLLMRGRPMAVENGRQKGKERTVIAR
jgi:hypothetical protein